MSLVTLALRAITTQALIGKTFCGSNVLDSPQNPFDTIEQGPLLSIYTGQSNATIDGVDFVHAEWKPDLSLHMHLPNEVVLNGTAIDVRKGGGEALFDILWRQIIRGLLSGQDKWATLWRSTVMSIDHLSSRPFMIETENGVRIQAREVIFNVGLPTDPPFGTITAGWWQNLVDTFVTDSQPEMIALGNILKIETESPTGLTDWKLLQASLGLNDTAMHGIGLSALGAGAADSYVLLQQTITTGNGGGTGNPQVLP